MIFQSRIASFRADLNQELPDDDADSAGSLEDDDLESLPGDQDGIEGGDL